MISPAHDQALAAAIQGSIINGKQYLDVANGDAAVAVSLLYAKLVETNYLPLETALYAIAGLSVHAAQAELNREAGIDGL